MLSKALILAALAGSALASASENFASLTNWADDSFYNGRQALPQDFQLTTSQPGSADGYALVIYAVSNNYTTSGGSYAYGERPKKKYNIPSNLNSNQGTHTWRVYIPSFRSGDVNSMGAFTYCDDHHEMDFEIGYGTSTLRSTWGVGSGQFTMCMTSQDTSASGTGGFAQSCIPVSEGWYTLAMKYAPDGSNRLVSTWYVNGVQKYTVTNQWTMMSCGVLVPRVSLENLSPGFMGNGGAQDKVYQAVFDTYTFA